jgi:AcrR family transcriptional regulator
MYNYFRSKEDLLSAIMDRSVTEVYGYFNPDNDSHLTPEEFELFIRKVFKILREKKQFWKLLFRIMMQPGVYEKLFGEESGSLTITQRPFREYTENMMSLLLSISAGRERNAGPDYDPMTDLLCSSMQSRVSPSHQFSRGTLTRGNTLRRSRMHLLKDTNDAWKSRN